MLINNSIAATMDVKVVEYNVYNNPNWKVIFIGDTIGYDNVIKMYNILVASPLVPDYNTMEADIEGYIWEFKSKYENILKSKDAMQYFATILAALHMGKFILLFFPTESEGLKYPIELLSHVAHYYGITVAFPEMGIQFNYDCNFNSFNANILYAYNLIVPEDYLLYTDPNEINYTKVVMDIGLPIRNNTSFETVRDWVLSYRNRIIKANKPLIRPFNLEVHNASIT